MRLDAHWMGPGVADFHFKRADGCYLLAFKDVQEPPEPEFNSLEDSKGGRLLADDGRKFPWAYSRFLSVYVFSNGVGSARKSQLHNFSPPFWGVPPPPPPTAPPQALSHRNARLCQRLAFCARSLV